MLRRAWIWYLATGALMTVVYFTVVKGTAQNVMYDGALLSSAVALVVGVKLWGPPDRRPWYLLAAAQTMTLLGELVYDWYDLVKKVDAPVPSLADLGYLAGYGFMIAGVVLVARGLAPRRDRGTLIDAVIVATGLGLLWWIFVVLPTVRSSPGSTVEQLTTLAYPMMDALLLFVLIRVAFERGVRTTALRLLALSVCATLAADVAYNIANLAGVYVDGSFMDAGWLAGFLFMGAAGLHPSIRRVADRTVDDRPRLTRIRLALLTAAALMAPAMLVVMGIRQDYGALPAIVIASTVVFGLVVVRMSGLFRDVQSSMGELHVRSGELEQAEARYRTVVEHIPAVSFLEHVDPGRDDERRTIYVSPQVEVTFGYTPTEWISAQPWQGLLDGADRDRILEADRRRVATEQPFREEYGVHARDGRLLWVESEMVLVGTAPDGSQVWQGVLFDMTAHRRAEEALREALGREREASTRLRALDEMKSTFLHAVSHELRTPLAAILGSALTLDREDLTLPPEDERDLVGRIAANARKLDRLLADLLDLDRLDRGIVEPQRRPTDVAALARRLVAESDGLAGRRVEVDAGVGVADVDPAKVERILENLLTNAARHTPPGTPVWVRVRTGDGALHLTVEDAGPGVSPELAPTVFEPFSQGPGRQRGTPGVGIGLSLVARFAELHGGRAWVTERPGGGASFHVLLPARTSSVERPAAASDDAA